MPIKILQFPKWVVGGVVGFLGAVAGSLTGDTVTKPQTPPAPPVDSADPGVLPEIVDTITSMSTTDFLIVLGIGMLAVYGLWTLFRGNRR